MGSFSFANSRSLFALETASGFKLKWSDVGRGSGSPAEASGLALSLEGCIRTLGDLGCKVYMPDILLQVWGRL